MASPNSESDRTNTLSTLDPPPPQREERPRSRRWLGRLTKVVLSLALLGGLAYGAYLLWPTVDERFFQPVSDNSADIDTLASRIDGLEVRIAELESRTETILASSDTATAEDTELLGRLDDLAAAIDAQTARLEGLEETAFGLAETDEIAAATLERELTVLKAMELMSRARLSLYQANYGLAREDVVAAREVLANLEVADETVAGAIDRLDVTITALPDRPVAAAADLDIAWQLILGDVVPPVTSTTTTGQQNTTTTSTP